MIPQNASQSQPKHNEVDVIDALSKTANNLVAKGRLFRHVNRMEEKITKDNSTYLKLSGNEKECVFSSTAPETKPTINVSCIL